MALPRHIPQCRKWDRTEVPFSYLEKIYGFQYHEADHIPASATRAWYPILLQEVGGKAYLLASAAAPIRVEVPPQGWTELDGSVVIEMKMGDHSYFPGQHGLIGMKVEDPRYPSAYLDGLGILFGGHTPDQLPPANVGSNYMHIDVTWGLVDLVPTGQSPVIPPPDPIPVTGMVAIPRALLMEVKRHAAASADLDTEITKYLNARPM